MSTSRRADPISLSRGFSPAGQKRNEVAQACLKKIKGCPRQGEEALLAHSPKRSGNRSSRLSSLSILSMGEKSIKRRRTANGSYEACGGPAQCTEASLLAAETKVGRGHWTEEENRILTKLCKECGNGPKNWNEISKHIKGRSAKQCRERWSFNLDPRIKHGPWSQKEDEILLKLQARLGNQWSRIARTITGRSENAVKTRYKSLCRAKLKIWSAKDDALLAQATDADFDCDYYHTLMPHHTKHAIKRRWEVLRVKRLALEVGIKPCRKPGQGLFCQKPTSTPASALAPQPSMSSRACTNKPELALDLPLPAVLPIKCFEVPPQSALRTKACTGSSPRGNRLVRRSTSMRIMQEFITPDIEKKRHSFGEKSAFELLERFNELMAVSRPFADTI